MPNRCAAAAQQPRGAAAKGNPVAGGKLVVEKSDHRGVLLDRGEELHESAVHVRPNGLVLERAGKSVDDALVRRNREMIAPEMDETLRKGAPSSPRFVRGREPELDNGVDRHRAPH